MIGKANRRTSKISAPVFFRFIIIGERSFIQINPNLAISVYRRVSGPYMTRSDQEESASLNQTKKSLWLDLLRATDKAKRYKKREYKLRCKHPYSRTISYKEKTAS